MGEDFPSVLRNTKKPYCRIFSPFFFVSLLRLRSFSYTRGSRTTGGAVIIHQLTREMENCQPYFWKKKKKKSFQFHPLEAVTEPSPWIPRSPLVFISVIKEDVSSTFTFKFERQTNKTRGPAPGR